MKRPSPALLQALLIMAAATQANAEQLATVQSGDHMDYGRIVINTNGPASFHVGHDGDHVTLVFDGDIALGSAPLPPRNVHSISTSGPMIELRVVDGARVQSSRQNGKVVLDIMDPVGPAIRRRATDARPDVPAPERMGAGDPATSAAPAPAPVSSPAAALPAVPAAQAAAAAPDTGAASAGALASPRPISAAPVAVQATPLADTGAATAAWTGATTASAPKQPGPLAAAQTGAAGATAPEADPVDLTEDDGPARPLPPGRDVAPEGPDMPMNLLIRRIRLPADAQGEAILVPMAATTGAAEFQNADGTWIVFDERRPVDAARLHDDPVFSGLTVHMLAGGTLLHIPPLQGLTPALTPRPTGWRITAEPATPREQPISFAVTDGKVNLAAEQPHAVLTMADPNTGATLLVGTQRRPNQGVLSTRRSTDFDLRPTLMGLVIEPLSDQVTLKPGQTGFQLTGGPDGLFISPQTGMTDILADAARLTRRFDFPSMATDALRTQLRDQMDEAANAPPLARPPIDRRAAETMLSLGMGAEAQGLLQLAAQLDPHEADSPDHAGLAGIAALMAGRVAESGTLDNPKLDGTDEIKLWRAIRQATLDEGSPAAAAVFANTAPLAMVYPPAMRARIVPLVMETMMQGGEIAPAQQLLAQLKDDPKLGYARALLTQAKGDVDGALKQLDTLANNADQYDSARAAVRAVELRLAAHQIDRKRAADALDKLLYAWRGDRRELALRERIAELRAQNRQWTDALGILRKAEADFPEHAQDVHAKLREMFTAMLHDTDTQRLRPIEFVSLVDDNAGLLHDKDLEDGVDQQLAESLLELDLPHRAAPVLERLMQEAATDEGRARYGLSLATMKDREGDPDGALAVLDRYQGSELPGDLAEERLLVRASALAHKGDTAGAVALLTPVHSAHATAARAEIEENAGDWPAAEHAWADCAALTVPAGNAPLDDAQTRTVLRLATATAHAKDDAGITTLRQTYGARIAPGPLGDMFRLLTAEPLQSTADIARSGRETSLAAALPQSLSALKADPAAAH